VSILGASIRKDVQLVLRDRGALVSLFVMPVVFMGVFGSMFSNSGAPEDARVIAVHHPPGDRRADTAVRALAASGAFEVREEVTAEAVRADVARADVAAGVVFPAGFDPLSGRPAELVIDLAGGAAVRAPIEGALSGIIGASLMGGRPPVVLEAKSPPGLRRPLDGASSFQLYVPGNAVLFGFFLAMTVGISFVGERKTGTFRRILAAPVRRSTVLLAKLVPYYLVGLTQMAFLFGTGALVFGMRVAGSPLGLVLLTAAVVFAAVSLGLVVASLSGTERQVGAIGSVCLLVMGLIGGGMVPRPFMPDTMKRIGMFTPHGWALDGYYDLLIREGTGVTDVLPHIAMVLVFGVGFATFGALRFRFER
jgi:ABC-2 type transport system permease protein